MNNAEFCCVENFPVLIPYRDLVKIVEVAKNMERYEKCLSRTNEQLTALRSQYAELCEKVREMDKLVNSNELILDAVHVLSGFALFAIVVCLCYFCYKFFRIFF